MLSCAVKQVVQKCANALGYRVERLRSSVTHIDVLTLAVELVLARQKCLFFVQIGANDGVTGDPIRHLILKHRLPGILVEPQPAAFRRLVENYSEQPQLRFENMAIGCHNGIMTMYTPAAHLQKDYLASFDRNTVAKHLHNKEAILTLEVETCTVDSLLAKHRVEHVDLLQVDTEGFDCSIVEMVDLKKLRPSIIAFEHIHVTTNAYNACIERLQNHEYQVLPRGFDTICIKSELLN